MEPLDSIERALNLRMPGVCGIFSLDYNIGTGIDLKTPCGCLFSLLYLQWLRWVTPFLEDCSPEVNHA